MLVHGTPGGIVKEWFQHTFLDETRTAPRTLSSMDSELPRIRALVMKGEHRHPEYDDTALRQYSDSEIAAFLDAPLSEQVAIQRKHKNEPSWIDGAEHALSQLKLLPANLQAFKLSSAEQLQLQRIKQANLVTKNEALIIIPDARKLLHFAMHLAETAKPSHPYPRLIAPLLLLSGRRLAEICNGRSTFDLSDSATKCTFTGQLKTKSAPQAYEIPLLCEFDVFRHCFTALRKKQGNDMAPLTEQQVTDRYSSNLLKSHVFGQLIPRRKNHDLRSIYGAYVNLLYICPHSVPRSTMEMLGHKSIALSLHYANVRLENGDNLRGSYGDLHGTDVEY